MFNRSILIFFFTILSAQAFSADFVILSFRGHTSSGVLMGNNSRYVPSELCRKSLAHYESIPFSEEYMKFLSPKKSVALNSALNECLRPFNLKFRAFLRNDYVVEHMSMHHDGRVDAMDGLKSLFGKRITPKLLKKTFGAGVPTQMGESGTTWVPQLQQIFR